MNTQVTYIVKGLLLFLLAAICYKLFIAIFPLHDRLVGTREVLHGKEIRSTRSSNVDGRRLFVEKCASCHHVMKDGTGPALKGFIEKDEWRDRKNVYAWIRNPAGYMKKSDYASNLMRAFGSVMIAFPALADHEIDAIIAYIHEDHN